LNLLKKKHDYFSNDDLNSEDIAFVARKFRKFILKKKNNGKDKKGKTFAKRNESENEVKVKLNLKKNLNILNAYDMVT
jgi:hypothetical protein